MTATEGLLTAMLAVQGEAPTLLKDHKATVKSDKGTYTYTYVALDTVVEKIGPILHKNGLVWITKPSYLAGVGPSLKYKLAHASTNEAEEGEMPLLLHKEDPQGQGSAITYARRYALCAVLGLVADDDDDGAQATAGAAVASRSGKGGPASAAQIAKVRGLFTTNRVTRGEARVMLRGAGVDVGEDEDPKDACARLRWPAVSKLIDFLVDGPVKDGRTDVPAESGFEHPPAQDDLFEPAQ
jgi:hypothetical protein